MSQAQHVTVAVGSTNRVKVDSARLALQLAFPTATFTVLGFDVASNVPAQPMGDAETRRGAYNRAVAAAEKYRVEHATYPTLALGMEGGCVEEIIDLPLWAPGRDASVPLAVEQRSTLHCFAVMAVLHCASQQFSFSRTASFALPEEVAKLVRGGVELGDADAAVFGRAADSKTKDGTVGYLTRGAISRTAYYSHALVLALVPLISREAYGIGDVVAALGQCARVVAELGTAAVSAEPVVK